MDFLHIELAHEVDGFLGDDLPRHHDREARRIRDHEIGRYEIRAALQATVDLGISKANIFAPRGVIGRVEARTNVALVGLVASVATETLVEMREVRQVGHASRQTFHPRFKSVAGVRAPLLRSPTAPAANLSNTPSTCP